MESLKTNSVLLKIRGIWLAIQMSQKERSVVPLMVGILQVTQVFLTILAIGLGLCIGQPSTMQTQRLLE